MGQLFPKSPTHNVYRAHKMLLWQQKCCQKQR